MKKISLSFFFLFFIFLVFPHHIFAATLFSDGFESGISSWSSSGGSAIATSAAELIHAGSFSIKVTHDKTASYGFQTIVSNVEPGMFYEILGYGRPGNANINSYFVRIAWYVSTDGSGSQLSQVNDSNAGSSSDTDWIELKASGIQAPINANSAKVRLVLTSKTSGQSASAYFDDVSFAESIAPTPTSTPTNTPMPTATRTPTPSTTLRASPTPTLRASPTSSPTPSKKPTPTSISSKSSNKDILGSSTQKNPKATSEPVLVKGMSTSPSPSPIFFILGGLGIITIACGILLFREWKKQREEEI